MVKKFKNEMSSMSKEIANCIDGQLSHLKTECQGKDYSPEVRKLIRRVGYDTLHEWPNVDSSVMHEVTEWFHAKYAMAFVKE